MPSSPRSRLRSSSLAAVALASSLALLAQGAVVAQADDLEAVTVSEAVPIASAEPVDEAVEPVDEVEPVDAAEAVEAEAAVAPVDIVEPIVEPSPELVAVAPVAEVPVEAVVALASEAPEAPEPSDSLVQENLPVVTEDDYFVIAPGATVTIGAPGILGNDSDPEGDPFVAQQEAFTTWLGNTGYIGPNGQFGFTAAPGFTGTDTITYYTQDAGHGGTPGTIYVTVQEQVDPMENHGPDPLNDFYTTPQDEVLVMPSHLGILANDTDPDGDVVTTQATSGMPTDAGGTVWIDSDGTFGYTPPSGFIGQDSFGYIAYDTFGGASWSRAFIGVTPAGTVPGGQNLPPIAGDDFYAIPNGHPLVVDAAHGALLNDSDPEGGAVTLTAGMEVTQIGVSVDIAADGSFSYTPLPGTWGDDYFSYTITDEAGLTTSGYVSISIAPFVPIGEPVITDPGTDPPVVEVPSVDVPAGDVPTAPIVEPAAATTTSPDRRDGDDDAADSELASTGFTGLPIGVASLGVLILGALVIVVARRRTR